MEKYTFNLKDGKVVIKKGMDVPSFTDSNEETVEEDQDIIIGYKEELVKCIDWAKISQNFHPIIIKEIVNKVGRSNRDKKIIIKAIYDAMLTTGDLDIIPFTVEKLLNDLYKKYDEGHKGLWDTAYDEKTETLNLDTINKSKLPEEFKTPEAEKLMQKLVNAGLLNNNWKPVNLSIAERGYLANDIAKRLIIKDNWKVMGALWNENPETLRQGMYRALEQEKTRAFIEKLKNVLD